MRASGDFQLLWRVSREGFWGLSRTLEGFREALWTLEGFGGLEGIEGIEDIESIEGRV